MAVDERQTAFETLLAPILQAAYGLALHLTGNRDDAEDLLQEASLLAFRGFHTFQPGTNFKAWYFKIVTNLSIQKHRRQRNNSQSAHIEELPELYLYEQTRRNGLNSRNADPVSAVLDRIDENKIAAAIGALPEEYRVVASLCFVEEFTYQEIAEMLDIPIGTVRSRVHRARRLLQKALWEMVNTGDNRPSAV